MRWGMGGGWMGIHVSLSLFCLLLPRDWQSFHSVLLAGDVQSTISTGLRATSRLQSTMQKSRSWAPSRVGPSTPHAHFINSVLKLSGDLPVSILPRDILLLCRYFQSSLVILCMTVPDAGSDGCGLKESGCVMFTIWKYS